MVRKANHTTAAEKRAAEARAALTTAQQNHSAARNALAVAEQAAAEARAGAAAGTASGADLAAAAANVQAARLRLEGTATVLSEAEAAERVAASEYHALVLGETIAAVAPTAGLRADVAAAVQPIVTEAATSALERNRKIAEAMTFARRAGLRQGEVDPFAVVQLDRSGALLLHGRQVRKLDTSAVVQDAVRDGIAQALRDADMPVPADLEPQPKAPRYGSTHLGAADEARVLNLATAMLRENLPASVRVEAVDAGQTVGVPVLDEGDVLVRVGHAMARTGDRGAITGSVTVAAYSRDSSSTPGSSLLALSNRQRDWTKPDMLRLEYTETSAGRHGGSAFEYFRRIVLSDMVADVSRLELSGVYFDEPPARVQAVKRRRAAGVYEYAPGHIVHHLDYDPRA